VMNEAFEQRVREAAAAATALPAPRDAWDRIAARIGAGDVVLLPVQTPRRYGLPLASHGIRVAALVLLICGAAAAVGLPGSALRQWLADVLTVRSDADPPSTSSSPAETGTPTPPRVPETTLVLEPADGGVVVALEAPAQQVVLVVRFAEAGEPEVRATGAAAAALFRSAAGRLTIAHASGGRLILTFPRSISRVRVEVDGETYLLKENGQIRVLAPAADTAGAEIVLPIRR
jgi:hypothetical protein